MNQKQNAPSCPNCHDSQAVIPFYYGLPTIDQILNAKSGSIAIGSAKMWPERPTHTCKSCLTEFNKQGVTGILTDPLFEIHNDQAVAA